LGQQKKSDSAAGRPSKRPLRKRPARRDVRGNRKTTRSPASHRNARCASGQIANTSEATEKRPDHQQAVETPAA